MRSKVMFDRGDNMTGSDEAYFDVVREAMDCFNLSDHEGVIDKCHLAMSMNPEGAEAYYIMGVVAFFFKDEGRALQLMERAHDLDPECRDYAESLASLSARVGRLADGVYYAKLAKALKPHEVFATIVPEVLRDFRKSLSKASPSTHFLEAQRLTNEGELKGAIAECEAELRLNRENTECYRFLGRLLDRKGEMERALSAFHAAVHLEPENPLNYAFLGDLLSRLGRREEARAALNHARNLSPDDSVVYAIYMASLPRLGTDWLTRCRADAQAWHKSRGKELRERVKNRHKARKRYGVKGHEAQKSAKLRVGYYSNLFYDTAGSRFVEALLKAHDRSRVEVFCYQQSVYVDSTTTRMQAAVDKWRKVYDVDDMTAAAIVESDEIDVAVDLSDHAVDSRIDFIGVRPAPVVLGWKGLPEPAAMPGLTHVLCDSVTEPKDGTLALAGVRKVMSEAGLFALDPFDTLSNDAPLPALQNNTVTFTAMRDLNRITPTVVAAWSGILRAVPNSRLVLGHMGHASEMVCNQLINMFANFGLSNRIHLAEPNEDDLHLPENVGTELGSSLLRMTDIYLDTYPISGTQDICEALWSGIPVVTLKSDGRQGRMGASILASANCEEWIAEDEASYVETAIRLAGDVKELEARRIRLQKEIPHSRLFKPRNLAAAVEKLYEDIAKRPKT